MRYSTDECVTYRGLRGNVVLQPRRRGVHDGWRSTRTWVEGEREREREREGHLLLSVVLHTSTMKHDGQTNR